VGVSAFNKDDSYRDVKLNIRAANFPGNCVRLKVCNKSHVDIPPIL